jgi:hypothetical protein
MPGISERELRAHFGAKRNLADHDTAPALTHFSRWDLPPGRHGMTTAVCGARISDTEATGEPTCPACKQWRDEFDALEIA